VKNVIRDYWGIFTIAALIVALDQWTKWLVRTNIAPGESWLPEALRWLSPYARIVHWYNRGAAFGIFQQGNMVFTVLAFIVIGAIIYYYPQISHLDWPLRLAMSMQMGGAIGNLVDRLTMGHVTDFISVGTFPVFNIADSSISVGCVVLLFGVWLQERTAKKEKKNAPPSDPTNEVTSEGPGSTPAL
jgi:signal peptidase II